MRADLHMHSYYSDGTFSIEELLNKAKSKGLDVIALTDHDSVKGVKEAIQLGQKMGIRVIPALELSTYLDGESVHVLGYFNGPVPEEIIEFSKGVFKARRERAYKLGMNMINIYGLKMDMERLMNQKGMITRSHLVTEVSLSNPNLTREYIFNNYLSDDSKGYIPSTKMTTEEGINLLRRNNALIVIAHPTLLKHHKIEEILKYHPDGIEAYYPKNKPGDLDHFLSLSKEYNLIVTAGSDFHMENDFSHADMATVTLEGEKLKIFLERLGEKK